MKKLAFIAHCQPQQHNNQIHNQLLNKNNAQHVPLTQQYLTDLLSKNLALYGFETQADENADWISVRVDDYPVALGVSCRTQENGQLMCEINVQADEEQDWFSKIETQSIVKQLTHAVENSLKNDPSIEICSG